MRSAIILLACLAVAGCVATMPANRSELPNTSTTIRQELPDSSATAAMVAKVMVANDITLPMVAAYLYNLGYTVHPSQLPKWHWSAPTVGAPVAYYAFEMIGATGDTTLIHYLPQAAGPYRLKVRGVAASGAVGPWSLIGWSDNGNGSNALPGAGP